MDKKEILKSKLNELITLNKQVNNLLLHDYDENMNDPKVVVMLGEFINTKLKTEKSRLKRRNVLRYQECVKCIKNVPLMIRICEKCENADRFLEDVRV